MDMLSVDQFLDHVGETFEAASEGGMVPLRLEQAQATAWSEARQSDSFRLLWSGPANAMLPQATYAINRGGQEYVMMIVPIEREADEIRYEAIFN